MKKYWIVMKMGETAPLYFGGYFGSNGNAMWTHWITGAVKYSKKGAEEIAGSLGAVSEEVCEDSPVGG